MASVSFSYRSKKSKAFLEVRLSYRTEANGTPISFYSRSKIEVDKKYWTLEHKRNTFDPVLKLRQKAINKDIDDLRDFVLNEFYKAKVEDITKEWFLKTLEAYYRTTEEETEETPIPTYLVEYIPFYLDYRKHEMSQTSITKYNVIKHKLERMEASLNKRFQIKDVNENFKLLFVEYYKSQNYSQNTIHRELGFIKTICKHAKTKKIETDPEMDTLKVKKDKDVPKIWLTFEELEKIENLKDLTPHLENAKDWLLISAYTGQRVSDFMRFTPDMIRTKSGKKLLEFKQKKTGSDMSIPLHDKVLAILSKRNGEFPHPISDQRYNEFIKKVCKKAELNQMLEGKLQKNISKDEKKKIFRIVSGTYPKWKLVSSHIGRRTFASNFYGKMPTSYLMNITGHTTEVMLREYLGKSKDDLAMETFKYF
ncbi:tyrosine-type recombinase/integrase [Bizionia paragorgiae]|uniref:tyrosine-type recombinase/integrase n=1 Tax=Bizionia paragorgiae TaxID=283786 RepID=UPI003A8D6357